MLNRLQISLVEGRPTVGGEVTQTRTMYILCREREVGIEGGGSAILID